MGDQVFVRGTVIENFDVLGRLDEDLGMAGERGCESRLQNKESPATQRGTLVEKPITVKGLSIITDGPRRPYSVLEQPSFADPSFVTRS